jgi:hypothetical protein
MPAKRTLKPTFTPSKWYRDDHAKMRASDTRDAWKRLQQGGRDADRIAIAYAEWLMARDGVDLEALTTAAVEAHNAEIRPDWRVGPSRRKYDANEHRRLTGERGGATQVRVFWEPCAGGMRPRFVVWRLSHAYANGRDVFLMELPHWAYVALEVVAWEEPEEALQLAA